MAKWQYKKIDRSVVLQDHNANSQYYKTKRTNRTDYLSEYERKKMYEDITNSVHKERQEYYKPVLKKLAEKQYMLYRLLELALRFHVKLLTHLSRKRL